LQSYPVNCCWPSKVQSFLVSGLFESHNYISFSRKPRLRQ
jgi:hypothetical protein